LTASTEPTGDAELVRLLDEHGQAEYELGTHPSERRYTRQQDTRAALLTYIAATYVRRDANRLPPSPPGSYRAARGVAPWQPGMPTPEEAIRRVRDGD
jgi:hypothetical protein